MCGLIGRNGAGKTTFMRAIMGALKAEAGSIVFDDEELTAIPAHKRVQMGIGFMPEDRRLVPDLTAEENIMLPVWSTKADGAEERLRWIYDLMPEVAAFRERGATELSGGQQKFVAFARALMGGRSFCCSTSPAKVSRRSSLSAWSRSFPI